jgi:predicted nicotinamide N-methyase
VNARRVADVGCGLGTLGLSALSAGAGRVLFADASPIAVDFLARTIAANALAPRADVVRHQWGASLPHAPWDIILGGDILYRPAWFPALMQTIAQSLAADGVALLSDPRTRLDTGLAELAGDAGLTWSSTRIDTTTIVRLGHRR